MIYIIDNGESYSSHAVYFVETKLSEETVEKLVRLEGNGTIDGVAEKIKWRVADGTCSAGSFFPPYNMFTSSSGVSLPSEAWSELTLAEIETLLPEWEEWCDGIGVGAGHKETLLRIRQEIAKRRSP